jgi:hypothetical protein
LSYGIDKNIPVILEKEVEGYKYKTLYPATDIVRNHEPPSPRPPRRTPSRDKKNFDILSLVPEVAVAVIEDGKLAFREGVWDARTGGLKRGYPKFKVGKVLPGEL